VLKSRMWLCGLHTSVVFLFSVEMELSSFSSPQHVQAMNLSLQILDKRRTSSRCPPWWEGGLAWCRTNHSMGFHRPLTLNASKYNPYPDHQCAVYRITFIHLFIRSFPHSFVHLPHCTSIFCHKTSRNFEYRSRSSVSFFQESHSSRIFVSRD